MSQRILILNFFTKQNSKFLSDGEDILNLKDILDNIEKKDKINVKESGFSLRVLGVLLVFLKESFSFVIEGTLVKRPLDDLFSFYDYYDILYNEKIENNKKVLSIKSPRFKLLKINNFDLKLINTSQVLTGLIMLSLIKSEEYAISVDRIISKEYIDLSLSLLKKLGVDIKFKDTKFIIKPSEVLVNTNLEPERDWNIASFFIAFAIVVKDIRILELSLKSMQNSKIFVDLVLDSGAKLLEKKDAILIYKGKIRGFKFSVEDYQDLFFPVLLLAIFTKTESEITGIKRLNFKESKRLSVALKILDSFDIKYFLKGDSLRIFPISLRDFKLINNKKEFKQICNDDHRVCMFFSLLLAILGKKPKKDFSVNKSYPAFFEDLDVLINNIP